MSDRSIQTGDESIATSFAKPASKGKPAGPFPSSRVKNPCDDEDLAKRPKSARLRLFPVRPDLHIRPTRFT